jgi:hypothetical protein
MIRNGQRRSGKLTPRREIIGGIEKKMKGNNL